jgi:uncharacterized membrane protein (UPF0127 family)
VPWLLRDDKVLASLEVASDRSARRRGLLGRDGFEGVLLFEGTRSVHSVGMRFPIDVAFCGPDLGIDGNGGGARPRRRRGAGGSWREGCPPMCFDVIKTMRVEPHRITLPVWKAHHVLEAEAGSFARWGLCVGDRLEIRGEHPDL